MFSRVSWISSEKNNIPWMNLKATLFDSCNVMRGKLSGVETRIRHEQAPRLLDTDGDSCHHFITALRSSQVPLETIFQIYLRICTQTSNDVHCVFFNIDGSQFILFRLIIWKSWVNIASVILGSYQTTIKDYKDDAKKV